MTAAIIDPTTWEDVIKFGSMMAAVLAAGSIVAINRHARTIVRMTAVAFVIAAICLMTVLESDRESKVEVGNVESIQKTFEVRNLHQIGNDRPGGGVWLDPSSGETTEVRAAWIDSSGDLIEGRVRMDATDTNHITASLVTDGDK